MVLIVGAGPVGLTLALACKKLGVPFRLIDRLAAPSGLSKALAIWSGTMETLDLLGLAGQVRAAGISSGGMRIGRGRRTLLEVPADLGVESPFAGLILLPQFETEGLLARALGPEVIERGVELTGLDSARTVAELRHPDGTIERVEPRWIAACDGAHSSVRHLLRAGFSGETLEEDYALCDARIEGCEEMAWAQLFWAPDGLLAVFPVIRGTWRVIASRPPGGGEVTLEALQEIVDRRGPGGWRLADPTWLTAFRVNERRIDSFVHGRVVFCGDAAHVHSPAGGQGMNTGMQDAFNLAWKLALLHAGHGNDEDVLASYHAERAPVVDAVIRESGRMIRSGLVGHPIGQLVRDAAARLVSRSPAAKSRVARQLSGTLVRYGPGLFTASDDAWHEDWRPHGFAPGTRLRDANVLRGSEPVSLWSEATGGDFTLLLFSGRRPIYRDVDRLTAVALVGESYGLRIVRVWRGDEPPPGGWLLDPDGSAHRRAGAEFSAAYLVRPDAHIALRSQPAEAGVVQAWLTGVFRSAAP